MNRWIMILLLVAVAGCGSPPLTPDEAEVPQKYAGLPGHLAAIMVQADWKTRTEYNDIQLHLAKLVQGYLLEREKLDEKTEKKNKEGAKLNLVNPASVVRYQREHPEIDGLSVAEVAPRLGVARVVHIEIEDFTAQPAGTIMLLKGNAVATLRVLEVAGPRATVALEERGINVVFPKGAPEGVAESDKVNVRTIYEGTLNALGEKIALRFGEVSR